MLQALEVSFVSTTWPNGQAGRAILSWQSIYAAFCLL